MKKKIFFFKSRHVIATKDARRPAHRPNRRRRGQQQQTNVRRRRRCQHATNNVYSLTCTIFKPINGPSCVSPTTRYSIITYSIPTINTIELFNEQRPHLLPLLLLLHRRRPHH